MWEKAEGISSSQRLVLRILKRIWKEDNQTRFIPCSCPLSNSQWDVLLHREAENPHTIVLWGRRMHGRIHLAADNFLQRCVKIAHNLKMVPIFLLNFSCFGCRSIACEIKSDYVKYFNGELKLLGTEQITYFFPRSPHLPSELKNKMWALQWPK